MQNLDAMSMRHLRLVGIFTWLIVSVTHAIWAWSDPLPQRAGFFAALLVFGLAFIAGTRDSCHGAREIALLALQSASALVAIAIRPNGFVPTLFVIVSAQLGSMRLPYALAWIAAETLMLGALDARDAVPKMLAYFAFQLFGLFTTRIAMEERDARQALAEANAELRVATGLLDMSSRAEERVRIAREIHDLLGHHLTALSLNLEVASHLAEGEAKAQIEKSQALTKLLLSDVRDSVSRLREDEPVDLAAALDAIRDAVPAPAIHIEAQELARLDPSVARTALRVVQEIVTNAVRHSGARNLWLTLATRENTLHVDARDDGAGTDHVNYGNGLHGMRERVQQAHGTMDVSSMRGRGFEVHVRLPLR
jgi:signal transduction histidine kinase